MNRFRNPVMRAQYDVALKAYRMRHRDLFRDGAPYPHGSSFAIFFWAGYGLARVPGRGRPVGMVGYAFYRAGEDCAKREPWDGVTQAREPVAVCRGSNTSVGGVQGASGRGRKVCCPICKRSVGVRAGRAGRIYSHAG